MSASALIPVLPISGLWQLASETNGYVLMRNGRSLLIDCPTVDAHRTLRRAGIPEPVAVLHTQVQEEHCREWAAFPQVPVYVSAASQAVATLSEEFFTDSATVWPPSREWDMRGEEKYGIAGCLTERPPVKPLPVADVLMPGQAFNWEGETLEVVALPGSGKRAIGLYWRETGVLFSGDLLRAGGYLVNLYDLERSYGILTGYEQLHHSLDAALLLRPKLLLPTTGPIIDDPVGDIAALRERLAWLQHPPLRKAEVRWGDCPPPRRIFGRYLERADGLYQNTESGNVVLYVDAAGRGLLIDPDPCVWKSWEENCTEMHAQLDQLEHETGLRRIEYALITHPHGDHLQYCDLLRERYATEILATPDVAALMERPRDYGYPGLVDWYGFPFTATRVDRRIAYEQVFQWHDTPVTPLHTPGHSYVHAGFFIPWHDLRTVCGGDTIQYSGGSISATLPVLYNDTAWPDRSPLATYRRLAALRPTLLLGGHGHCFRVQDQAIWSAFIAVTEEAIRLATAMVHDGDLAHAMTPPDFNAKRPAQCLTPGGGTRPATERLGS